MGGGGGGSGGGVGGPAGGRGRGGSRGWGGFRAGGPGGALRLTLSFRAAFTSGTAARSQDVRTLWTIVTERARAGGLQLTGEGGLLGKLTKMVIEGALEGSWTTISAMASTMRQAVMAGIPATGTGLRR